MPTPPFIPPLPPILFAATSCRSLGTRDNCKEEYWSADIKAVRHGLFEKIFTDVLFVETPGEMVFLAGSESADGIDRFIAEERAKKQAEFIAFLRDQNDRNYPSGAEGLRDLFEGSRYATIARATVAYLAARSLTHPFGVGYLDVDGEYKTIGIIPDDESGWDVNCVPLFDQLSAYDIHPRRANNG